MACSLDSPPMPSSENAADFARARRRMRWREGAVVLLASAAMAAVILGTIRSELEKARARFARDTLHHLAAHVSVAMQRAAARGEDPREWAFPLLGPGAESPGGAGTPLTLVLPAGAWLPRDPWGRGYRVLLAGAEPHRYPLLMSGGPEGEFGLNAPDPRWTEPILWP